MESAAETAQKRSIDHIHQSARRQAPHARQEALKYDTQSFCVQNKHWRDGQGLPLWCTQVQWAGTVYKLFSTAISLDSFPPLLDYLAQLYYSDMPDSRHFLASIWKYNHAFQMTSFGCSEVHLPGLNPSFRVQGQVFHRIGSLLPQPDQTPQFLQVYFINNHCEETSTCMNITTGLKEHVVNNLGKILQCNQSVQLLKTARELLERDGLHTYQVVIIEERRFPGDHARWFNVPI